MTQTTATAAKITASQVMMNQDRIDTLITLYKRAATQEEADKIKAEYEALEAENAAYFAARKK